jgi:hypothetical protein
MKFRLSKIFGEEGTVLFLKGVELFNSGSHWEAHEVFEDVWRVQTGDAKKLAQGFVQLAAAFSYIKKQRYDSILYLFDKSAEKFAATPHLLPGATIPQLVDAIKVARAEVERMGAAGLDKFSQSLYPHIVIDSGVSRFHGRKVRRRK